MADNSAEIAELEKMLNTGIKQVTVDGVLTTFRSDAEIRKRLRELEADDDSNKGRRPRLSSIDIGASY